MYTLYPNDSQLSSQSVHDRRGNLFGTTGVLNDLICHFKVDHVLVISRRGMFIAAPGTLPCSKETSCRVPALERASVGLGSATRLTISLDAFTVHEVATQQRFHCLICMATRLSYEYNTCIQVHRLGFNKGGDELKHACLIWLHLRMANEANVLVPPVLR